MYDEFLLICDTDDFTFIWIILKAMSHSFSQASYLIRSVWREVQSSWFEIVRYTMSSAKSLVLLMIVSDVSLIYIRKRQGLRTVPCGTPDRAGYESECSQSRTMFWVRLDLADDLVVNAESMVLLQEPLMINRIKSLAEVHDYLIGLSFLVSCVEEILCKLNELGLAAY